MANEISTKIACAKAAVICFDFVYGSVLFCICVVCTSDLKSPENLTHAHVELKTVAQHLLVSKTIKKMVAELIPQTETLYYVALCFY